LRTDYQTPLNGLPLRSPDGLPFWAFFSHSGDRIFSGGQGSQIWIWDTKRLELSGSIETNLSLIPQADLHPVQDRLAISHEETIYLWDINRVEAVAIIKTEHRQRISAVRFTGAGQLILSASQDGTVRLNDATTGKPVGRLKRFKRGQNYIHGLAVARDGSYFGAVHQHGVDVWTSDLNDVFHLEGYYYHGGKGQEDLAFSGSKLWVSFRSPPHMCVWDLKNNQQRVLHAEVFGNDIYCKHYKQQYIAKPLHKLEFGQQANHLAFSPDEKLVAVGLRDALLLIDSVSGKIVHRWRVPPLDNEKYPSSPISRLCFSTDGRLLSSMAGQGCIWVWSVPEL
jgi:WD40 repeat protein